jgi:DnaK suppressor protein
VADNSELYKKLQKERAELQERIEQMRVRGQPSADRREGSPFGKREEGADEASELEKRLVQEKRLIDALSDVEHAIEKYEAGTYGRCDACGQSIEQARLEAMPQASLCLSCKSTKVKDARGEWVPK